VDIFFVLSGFLITTLLLQEQSVFGRVDLGAFYLRRFFRIVPLYALMLITYLALCYNSPLKWELIKSALPHYLTFTNEFVPLGTPYSFSWTLGIEEKFYLVWPVLYFVFLRGRGRLLALVLLYPALIAMLSFRSGRSYCGLMAGCVLAIFLSSRGLAGAKKFLSEKPTFLFAGFVIMGFYLVSRDERFTFLFAWIIAALIAHLLLSENWLGKALGVGWLTWIGRRSYGIYLIHGLAIDAVEAAIRPTNAFRQISVSVLTLAGAALIAEPIFRLVEEPARAYGKTLLKPKIAAQPRASEILGRA
jgi:peptidoglycan/LPS O-acetylase OafA/YrhL